MLKVNVERVIKAQEERGIDPRVEVRYGLLKGMGRLSDAEIDLKLKEKASSDSPGASLSDLIKGMVKEVAYGQAKLSLPEFIERFKKNRLADVIASKFANSIYQIDNDGALLQGIRTEEPLDPELLEKRRELALHKIIFFVEKFNLSGSETLFEFLKQTKSAYPSVEMSRLFLEEYEETKKGKVRHITLREKVAEKINANIDRLASEAYQEKFNEDKRGFVMGYMTARVIKPDPANDNATGFDKVEFMNLMTYLDSIGYAINRMNGETLYDWLYAESRQVAKYDEERRVESTVAGVRDSIVATVANDVVVNDVALADKPKESQSIFGKGFNVKKFHDEYVKPSIYKFYSQKLGELVQVREIDLFDKLEDPDNMGQTNLTAQMMDYVRALVNTAKSNEKNFLMKMRGVFGLNDSPFMRRLSNQEVKEYFALCFERAREKHEETVKEALAYRKDLEVHKACKYPDEILECTDLARILEWFIDPQEFKRQHHNKYDDWADDKISFACGAFLLDFLKISRDLNKKHFQEAGDRRDALEAYMTKALDIKKVQNIDLKFRLLEEIDENGKPLEPPVYESVYDTRGVREFTGEGNLDEMDRALKTTEDTVFYKGKRFKVNPLEEKKFQKVTMKIPVIYKNDKGVFERGEPVLTQALIYRGDSHYVHVKEEIPMLSAKDRGKDISDENRWMLAFADEKGLGAFRDFMYSNHARNLIKVDDIGENRQLNRKKKHQRGDGSKKFKNTQVFAMASVYSFPVLRSEQPSLKLVKEVRQAKMQKALMGAIALEPKEEKKKSKLQMVDTMLETQVQSLDAMLCHNLSDYSATGHDPYKSERAWPLLYKLYCPPEYWGDEFKEFQLEGFRKTA